MVDKVENVEKGGGEGGEGCWIRWIRMVDTSCSKLFLASHWVNKHPINISS